MGQPMKMPCSAHFQYREGCMQCKARNGEVDPVDASVEEKTAYVAGLTEADAFLGALLGEDDFAKAVEADALKNPGEPVLEKDDENDVLATAVEAAVNAEAEK
jgi:hypothetical protein